LLPGLQKAAEFNGRARSASDRLQLSATQFRLALFIGAQNLLFRLRRKEFRTFAHPPSEMLAILEERGFRQTFAHHALVTPPLWDQLEARL
jgi:hypothetical protein